MSPLAKVSSQCGVSLQNPVPWRQTGPRLGAEASWVLESILSTLIQLKQEEEGCWAWKGKPRTPTSSPERRGWPSPWTCLNTHATATRYNARMNDWHLTSSTSSSTILKGQPCPTSTCSGALPCFNSLLGTLSDNPVLVLPISSLSFQDEHSKFRQVLSCLVTRFSMQCSLLRLQKDLLWIPVPE